VSDLTPTEGARFLLELVRQDVTGASYRLAIYTPTQTFEGQAALGFDGGVALELASTPPELAATAEMFAKLTARSAAKRRDDGMPPWPVRVLRWRGPGRGT
jgi:hypothetical protein